MTGSLAARRALVGAGVLVLAILTLAAAKVEPGADAWGALREGNDLYRGGRIEAAVAAYERGYSPRSPHPTLVYNLGTALHHLGRLPEAILWYLRAADSRDPWLEENLWLARRSLGTQALEPGGPLGWLAQNGDGLRWAAIAAAWGWLLLTVALPRPPIWGLVAGALLAAALYAAAAGVERWGPRPAVDLADCVSAAGELPAGTEVWVRPQADGRFRVSGSGAVCDRETVALVFPEP